MIKRVLLLCSIVICYLLFANTPAHAQQEFSTRFTSTYTVSEEGVTRVQHLIELTNQFAKVYASEYALTIGSTRIKDIQTQSNAGKISQEISTDENTTNIKLLFTDPVVGKSQTLRFTVSYINLDIASKNGRVLEVNIPHIAGLQNIDTYNLTVRVPDSFDDPAIISPQAASITKDSGQQILHFTKKQLTSKGISILFGDHQIYNFTLRYTLKNPGVTHGQVQIAIPPDTAYQKLFYQEINPTPENITEDTDGNWLAHYTLKPQQTLFVTASGQAVLYLEPVLPTNPDQDYRQYLSAKKYWPVTDPTIVSLAQKLKTPENIYNYIVENLRYNYDRIDASTSRLGAKAALTNPQNVICTEFTDLFVTLARAAGIPARSQDGFAFTTNPKLRPLSLRLDILHAWPEYFDQQQKRWVPVDPTWGNTTQGIDYFSRWDLNHFTFAIHGSDSITPYPAGAYKLASTQGKDVNVAFSLTQPTATSNLDVSFASPKLALRQEVKITIANQGNTALRGIDISTQAPGYNILGDSQTSLAILPPKAHQTLTVKLKRQGLLPQNNLLFTSINGETYRYEITPTKFGITQVFQVLTFIGLGAIIVFAAQRARRLLVQRFKKKNPLHRQSQKPQK